MRDNIKILYFLAEQNFGLTSLFAGQAIHLSNLKNCDFLYVTGTTEKEPELFKFLEDNNIRPSRLNGLEHHKNFHKLCMDLASAVDMHGSEIVHVQTNWQLAMAIYLKLIRRYKFKIFYTIHAFRHNSKYKSFLARVIIGLMLRIFVHKAIACSEYTRNKFMFITRNISVIHLGVDDAFFELSEINNRVANDQLRMTFVGEFRDGKNQELLIKTLRRLLDENPYLNINLTLAGTGANFSNCAKLIHNLNLCKHVTTPGFVSKLEVRDLLKNTDIAIIPTNSETFGLCIAEAFAAGCCVVSRNVGVACEIIDDGINGYIFEADDDLFHILRFLTINKELISSCRFKAYSERHSFEWARISNKYSSAYKA